MLLGTQIKNRLFTFIMEGIVIALPCFIVYLVEVKQSYVLLLGVLPLIWWRIWNNSQYFLERYYKEINYNTYKQAWDSLPIPVAIANDKQEIILINEAMYGFMMKHLQQKFRSIKKLWQSLEQPKSYNICVTKEYGKLILKLSEGSTYWAELEPFRFEGESYVQLTLTDISHQELQYDKDIDFLKDKEKSEGLLQLLNNLEEIKRQEVAEEIHGRLHDFMGQRIAILQRLLSEKDTEDYIRLVPMLENVLQDMRTAALQSPQLQLTNIVSSFRTMGLNLKVEGNLPERQDWAQCFVNMIREGATNAVRHGEATEVEVAIKQQPTGAQITVASNGKVPTSFEKGKGLQGITKSFDALGGNLDIVIEDTFILKGRVGAFADEAINS